MPATPHARALARAQAQIAREQAQALSRAEGLAWARAWRARNKPIFDAIYGPERCACGSMKG
jgi:hypothetical protein